jgi:ATP-binding cassette subfamily B (MDR/TAP) protein 1
MQAITILYASMAIAGEQESTAVAFSLANESVGPGPLHYCSANGCPYDLLSTLATRPSYAECSARGMSPLLLTCSSALTFTNFSGSASQREQMSHAVSASMTALGSRAPCAVNAADAFSVMMMVSIGLIMLAIGARPLMELKEARIACRRVLAIINRVPHIDAFSEDGARLESVRGQVSVQEVVFAYPTRPGFLVCRGYSLEVEAGKVCALCGPSGSGKSTIIQLIERFYDPRSGSVLLDGVDIRTLNVRWLRSQLGLVSQEPVLFIGTVEENIAYGKAGASRDEIEAAARMANAHGFITDSLSDGYATQVGQGGGKLSGGQKQRVAIARALVRRPSVLLLDEATSALDSESEKVVQAALDEIMAKQKRTTLVIAHRLSTIRDADKIAVVSDGAIVEQGSHAELIELKAVYYKLARSTL